MKLQIAALFTVIILTAGIEVSAQEQARYATILKNSNVAARSLRHDLNSSRDTLVLSSSELIHRVYTAGKTRGMVDVIVNKKKFDLPLKNLVEGKHVIVVQDLSRKIVFQIFIHESRKNYPGRRAGE